LPPTGSGPIHSQPKYGANYEIKADQNTGEFKFTVHNDVPTGTYSFFLSALATVNYARNAEALKAAQGRKAAIEKIVTADAAAAKAAVEGQTVAENKRLEADVALAKAAANLKLAQKSVADAQIIIVGATAKLAEAEVALSKEPESPAAVAVKQAADKTLVEANDKLKVLADAKLAADGAVAVGIQELNNVTDAKAAADKVAANADAKAKQSAAFLQTFAQRVAALEATSKPADIVISAPSIPVTMRITPAPINLELTSAVVQLKQGTVQELPVSIRRLYEYTGPVQIGLLPSNELGGLSAAHMTIAEGQTQGKLNIRAHTDAMPGTRALSLRATAVYNGQNLSFDQLLSFVIEKSPPK
jgi:hypothetical protein